MYKIEVEDPGLRGPVQKEEKTGKRE